MNMTDRTTVTSALTALADELATLGKEEMRASISMLKYQSIWHEAEEEGQYLDPEDVKAAQALESQHRAVKGTIRAIRDRLGSIGVAIHQDGAEWNGERAAYTRALTVLGSIERASAQPLPPLPSIATVPIAPDAPSIDEEPTLSNDTLLSVAALPILRGRREALEAGGEKSRYADRLDDTTSAFINVIGDKPLKSYMPADIQTYANVLGRIPKNRKKYRVFHGLSLREMADKNSKLIKPYPGLSETTIQSYLTDFCTVWMGASASVPNVRDIGAGHVTMPRSATPAIDRQGLPIEHINLWLSSSAERSSKGGDFNWLPLVGLITGMRLAELVFLQPKDFVEIKGNLVIDLRNPLIVGVHERRRPLKTKTSKRIVAIHQVLHDVGFVDWAMSQDKWVFDRFHGAKDPSDAAQKRMGYWMTQLGIHESQSGVFHSLRHNAKAWMRLHVQHYVADFQCGHAPTGEGAKYGFRVLLPEEVRQLEKIPLPNEIDLSPLLSRRGRE